MKRMLINATQEEELRMAMVDGQRLYDLNIEGPASERKKANIYKGKITRIEPSLEAAFVDYGADRHGFLPLKEVSSEYFVKQVPKGEKPSIKSVLKEGQDIVVQIDKEERGNKGAALTTFVSLAGRFIVLKPNKDRSGGVSRRITGQDRDAARRSLDEIEVPDGMSVILRTAGIDRSAEELAWDLENLLSVWQAILNVVLQRPSPFLIYRESNAVVRALRDYLTNEIGEILIDDEATYKEASEFVEQVMPHNLKKLKHYQDPVPLFTRFQIESQIESAFAHSVSLPSGGSIVIDHTEALVSIDINSARATKGGDIEATALNTNLEAADEIARQLRIRDLGGLIVIDFIDMGPQKNQRAVENRLREAVRQDRARVQIGKISRFGLLEMSRQRLRPSLGESSYITCPRCSGFGTIRSVESLALAILRIVGEEARKERTAKVIAQLPVEVATYLLNEKRDWVQSLEARHDTQVILVANSLLETPHYDVRRVRDDQTELPENAGVSYLLADSGPEVEVPESMQEKKPVEQAAVGKIAPAAPAPARKPEPAGPSLWDRIVALFRGGDEDDSPKKMRKKTKKKARSGQRRKGEAKGRDDQQRGRRGGQKQADSRGKSSKKKTRKKAAKKKKAADAPDKGQEQDKKKSAAAADDGQKRDDGKRSRGRRSRGGRRRRRGASRAEGGAGEQQAGKADGGKPASGNKAADSQPAQQKKEQESGQKREPKKAAPDGDRKAGHGDSSQQRSDKEAAPKPVRSEGAERERKPDRKPDRKPADEAVASDDAQAGREKEQKAERQAPPKRDRDPADHGASPSADKAAAASGDVNAEPATRSKPDRKPADERPSKSPGKAAASDDKSAPKNKEAAAEASGGNGTQVDSNGGGSDGRLLPWEPADPPASRKPDTHPQKSEEKAGAGD